uniref:Uncharacterized protein n=1 Tax=viral metagenome TaxID=1070528 RepID=A0A6C0CG66_9ZZZZ
MDADLHANSQEEYFLYLFRVIGSQNLVNIYCNSLETQRDCKHNLDEQTFRSHIKFLRESGHSAPEVLAKTWAHEMRNPTTPIAQAIEETIATAKWLLPENSSFSPSSVFEEDLTSQDDQESKTFMKNFCDALEEQPDLIPLDIEQLLERDECVDIANDLKAEYDAMLAETQIAFFKKYGNRIPVSVMMSFLTEEVENGDEQMADIAGTMGLDL